MRILMWHVHGSWTTAFVQGRHEYVVPVLPDQGPDGRGRARTWTWPDSVVERTPSQLREEPVDVVILQRPTELELVREWLGRDPGGQLPAIYLEHNTPEDKPCLQRHPMADRVDIPIVHVTGFNQLFWDNGRAKTAVIEHGIIDPGPRYTGELAAGAVVVNEPGRRGRLVGADLVPRFAEVGPVDVFGMQAKAFVQSIPDHRSPIAAYEDLFSQDQLHTELARRRVYLHPMRWTSLGLSLIEAMHLAMPVVVLAATEAVSAVPPGAGVLSTDFAVLRDGFRTLLHEPEAARRAGATARSTALRRYGLERFLTDWDRLLLEHTRSEVST
jgi:glycosyltransferase involved in cell wall biosynthesis